MMDISSCMAYSFGNVMFITKLNEFFSADNYRIVLEMEGDITDQIDVNEILQNGRARSVADPGFPVGGAPTS